jgi:phage terminase large subunit
VPALKRHSQKFNPARWKFQERAIKHFDPASETWCDRYIGFAAEDEHGFQGFHGADGVPLLMILDESQGIKQDIANAAEDRCNPDFMLICGSPGDPQGYFYDCETKNAAHYQHFMLPKHECTKSKGWWIEDADIDRMIAKHGADNPFIKSTVYAEFSDIVENALITLSEYDRCLHNPPQFQPGDRRGFCDFAAGRDKNVFAVANGNKVELRKKWVDRNTMSAVGEFVMMFKTEERQTGLLAAEISGDADGLGLPMVQRLQEIGWQINEFHGGKPPRFDDSYKNAIAEAWGEGCNQIKRLQVILPADLDLKAQILGRKAKRNSSGKLELESKEDMKKRGLNSPDEADAVFGAMMPAPQARSVNLIGNKMPGNWQEAIEEATAGQHGPVFFQ